MDEVKRAIGVAANLPTIKRKRLHFRIDNEFDALEHALGGPLNIIDYNEHAIGHGTDARAAAYVECRVGDGPILFGVGISQDVATASVRAILSAANGA
jgi:hypothetical protein